VGPGPSSAGVIRAARTKAKNLDAKLFAVHVEAPGALLLPESEREQVLDNLRLAEQLGAEPVTLTGRSIAESVINFARERNIARIVAGKPVQSRLKGLLFKSPVDWLLRNSGDIDIEIVSGEPGEPVPIPYTVRSSGINWPDYGTAVLFLLLATGVCFLMFTHFDLSNLIMVYLLAVMVTAIECGRGPAIMASVVSVLAFDFFFVPPRFSFNVDEAQYIVTFVVMLIVALAISHLTARMQGQTEIARLQEKQAAAMHGLSRQLAASRRVDNTLRIGVEYIGEIFDSHVLIMLPGADSQLTPAAGDPSAVFLKDFTKELQLARKAFETGDTTGLGIHAGQDSELLYVPLTVADTTLGVLALRPGDPARLGLPDQRYLLESLVKQVALALEAEYLSESHTGVEPNLTGLGRIQTKSDFTAES
jgi:two-component system, OmpR family, sensor histidine kinase KdpD